jgi:hypothetical protein
MMKFRFAAAAATAAGLLLLTAGAAWAGGPPVVNQHDRFVNETETSTDVHPCTGQPIELTLTESGHIHFTFFANGTVHITGTLRGSFSLDLLPADGTPDATGTFTTWFGGNGMLLEEGGATGRGEMGFTLNGRGTNADGSMFRFHQNGHMVFDSAGVPKLDFAKSHCS